MIVWIGQVEALDASAAEAARQEALQKAAEETAKQKTEEEEIRQLADGSETVTRKYWVVMSSREVPKDELMYLSMAREQKPMPSANWTGPKEDSRDEALHAALVYFANR